MRIEKEEILIFLRYSVVGVSTTLLFSGMTWFFTRTDWPYPLYTAVIYTVSIIFNFMMHSLFTFQMNPRRILGGGVIFKFLGVTLSLTGLVQVIQWVLIDKIGFREIIGVGAGMLFYVSFSFFLHRFWVFRHVARGCVEKASAANSTEGSIEKESFGSGRAKNIG